MALYRFDDVLLEVQPDVASERARLPLLLPELSWRVITQDLEDRSARLSLRLHSGGATIPPGAQQTVTTTSFSGYQLEDIFYLTDGASVLCLDGTRGEADAYLADSFFDKPLTVQYTFWSFAVARLLRTCGGYVLHAAGLASPGGNVGVLLIGPSGSGKSTATLAAVRHGWRYVSDDAVVLRHGERATGAARSRPVPATVVARGGRSHCYVDADAVPRHEAFLFGRHVPDTSGGSRRRVLLEGPLSGRRVDACTPRLLLFPRIVDAERTRFVPLDRITAFSRLLEASCDQLWDRRMMIPHTHVIGALVRQAAAYEMLAGRDVFGNVNGLFQQMSAIASEAPCAAS